MRNSLTLFSSSQDMLIKLNNTLLRNEFEIFCEINVFNIVIVGHRKNNSFNVNLCSILPK